MESLALVSDPAPETAATTMKAIVQDGVRLARQARAPRRSTSRRSTTTSVLVRVRAAGGQRRRLAA